jgi:type I restriction enzyme, S subunit
MRDGWQAKTLSELCALELGKTPARANKGFWDENRETENVWLSIADLLNGEDNIVVDSKEYLSNKGAAICKVVREGTLLVSFKLTLGRTAFAGRDLFTNEAIAAITILDSEELSKDFLFYFFQFFDWDKATEGDVKVKGKTLNKAKLKQISVAFPSMSEQRRIVGILDEAFAGIAAAKANAEQNLRNVRALFASRLASAFTEGGDDWVEKSVSQLVADGTLVKPFDGNHGEIHPRKSDYTESGVPFIMASDLRNGEVDTENCKFISRGLASTLRVGFARDGDVLISHKGTIGRSAVVRTKDEYIMLTPQVTSYRVADNSRLFNRFVRYYFMSPVFQQEMIAGAEGGSTRAYIGITKQLTLRFRFPSLQAQHEIVKKLDALDCETQRLASVYQRKLAALVELKQALLHQAFSGEL